MKKKKFKKIFLYYLPPFFWMGVIFVFSSFQGSESGNPNSYGQILVRKMAHILEFSILTFLFFNFFGKINKRKVSWEDSFCWSLIASSLFAFSDELHQHFILGRNGRVEDFLLDISSSWLILQIISFKKVKFGRKIKWTLIFFNILILFISLFLLLKEGLSREEIKVYYKAKWIREHPTENKEDNLEISVSENKDKNENIEKENKQVIVNNESEEELERKEEVFISGVPFTSQAPFAVWDEKHDESCEEASIIMLEYYKNKKSLTKKEAEKEIQEIVEYQIEKYGDYKDSNAYEIAKLAKDFYELELEVLYDFSLEDIRKYLSLGKPIIVPAAGRELGNPFFTPPGPLYHNLVLIGYDKNNFITNDPGTKRGKEYIYNQEKLFEAIHDFPGRKKDILKGGKAMLVLKE